MARKRLSYQDFLARRAEGPSKLTIPQWMYDFAALAVAVDVECCRGNHGCCGNPLLKQAKRGESGVDEG